MPARGHEGLDARLARSQAKIGLIILDSATVYYRLDYNSDDTLRKNLLSQILTLLSLARQENVAVVLTNQVYTDPQLFDKRRAVEMLPKLGLKPLHPSQRGSGTER